MNATFSVSTNVTRTQAALAVVQDAGVDGGRGQPRVAGVDVGTPDDAVGRAGDVEQPRRADRLVLKRRQVARIGLRLQQAAAQAAQAFADGQRLVELAVLGVFVLQRLEFAVQTLTAGADVLIELALQVGDGAVGPGADLVDLFLGVGAQGDLVLVGERRAAPRRPAGRRATAIRDPWTDTPWREWTVRQARPRGLELPPFLGRSAAETRRRELRLQIADCRLKDGQLSLFSRDAERRRASSALRSASRLNLSTFRPVNLQSAIYSQLSSHR